MGGGGYLCPTSHIARRDHQNDKTLGWPVRVSFNVSTVVGNKVTKTVSEDTTVENNSRYSERELPSPPLKRCLVNSLVALELRRKSISVQHPYMLRKADGRQTAMSALTPSDHAPPPI